MLHADTTLHSDGVTCNSSFLVDFRFLYSNVWSPSCLFPMCIHWHTICLTKSIAAIA